MLPCSKLKSSSASRPVLTTPFPALGHFSGPPLNSLWYFHILLKTETLELARQGKITALPTLPWGIACAEILYAQPWSSHYPTRLVASARFFLGKAVYPQPDQKLTKHGQCCPERRASLLVPSPGDAAPLLPLNITALPVSCHGRSPGFSSPSSAGEQGLSKHP